MKIGDIVHNLWAGDGNPSRVMMYIGGNRFIKKNGSIDSCPDAVKNEYGAYPILGNIDLRKYGK